MIASGANRVDEARFGAVKADAAFVREQTGYAIGGVPPFAARPPDGHASSTRTCWRYDVVWAAAGTPRAVFPIAPGALVEVSGGRVARWPGLTRVRGQSTSSSSSSSSSSV